MGGAHTDVEMLTHGGFCPLNNRSSENWQKSPPATIAHSLSDRRSTSCTTALNCFVRKLLDEVPSIAIT